VREHALRLAVIVLSILTIVYGGTSDHANRVGFDPKKLQQIPAEQSIAAIDQSAGRIVAYA
jgi:hypothetical protein